MHSDGEDSAGANDDAAASPTRAEISISNDVSGEAVGAVLQQRPNMAVRGNHWLTLVRSCDRQRRNTARLTASCWTYTWASGTFAIIWKAEISDLHRSSTTDVRQWRKVPSLGRTDNPAIWNTFSQYSTDIRHISGQITPWRTRFRERPSRKSG